MREILGLTNRVKILKTLTIQEMRIRLFRVRKRKKRDEIRKITKRVSRVGK